MNWDNTHAVFDGEDWVFTGVPIEAGWDTGTTAFSQYELGVCSTPEQAINALKDWVQSEDEENIDIDLDGGLSATNEQEE